MADDVSWREDRVALAMTLNCFRGTFEEFLEEIAKLRHRYPKIDFEKVLNLAREAL